MTKRDCRKIAYHVAGLLLHQYLTVDGHCPATKSGSWRDLSEEDHIRLSDEVKRLSRELIEKGGQEKNA